MTITSGDHPMNATNSPHISTVQDTPRTVVSRYLQAVADGDADLIRASFAPDATWTYPGDLPLSGTWRGRDAIMNDFLGTLGPVFPDGVTLTPGVMIVEGDTVAAAWSAEAVSRDGVEYRNENLGVFTVRDGLITSAVEYTDTRRAARVFGATG